MCSYEYTGRTAAYRLFADFQESNSYDSRVTLSEKLVPNTGSISGPGGNTRWAKFIDGPPSPQFNVDVRKSAISKLSDKDLSALQSALFQATEDNPDDW